MLTSDQTTFPKQFVATLSAVAVAVLACICVSEAAGMNNPPSGSGQPMFTFADVVQGSSDESDEEVEDDRNVTLRESLPSETVFAWADEPLPSDSQEDGDELGAIGKPSTGTVPVEGCEFAGETPLKVGAICKHSTGTVPVEGLSPLPEHVVGSVPLVEPSPLLRERGVIAPDAEDLLAELDEFLEGIVLTGARDQGDAAKDDRAKMRATY